MLDHDYKAKLREEAYGDARKIIQEELAMKNDYELDLDDIAPAQHNWVKRGCILSCEGAGHPSHRHYVKDKRDSTESTQA